MEIKIKRILMISFRYPWPANQGYTLRILNMAGILAKHYKIDLATLAEKGQITQESSQNLRKIFDRVIVFPHSKTKGFAIAAKTIFSFSPLQTSYYWSADMEDWIEKNQKEYNFVYLNTIRTVPYAKKLKIIKIIDLIDAISLNYYSAQKYLSFFKKTIYSREMEKVLKAELDILKDGEFQKIFIASPFDKNYLERKLGRRQENLIILSNGVKENLLNIKPLEEDQISFLGKMDYLPNEDAVIHFSKKILPKIKKEFPQLKFYIIGTNPSRRIKKLEKESGVIVTGFIEDPYRILCKSKLIVAPLRFGAGIQNKVLEAMALEKTVITSEIGARGIHAAQDNENLIIANFDEPESSAKKIIDILKNTRLREKIGKNARKLISQNYTWNIINNELLFNIESLQNKSMKFED